MKANIYGFINDITLIVFLRLITNPKSDFKFFKRISITWVWKYRYEMRASIYLFKPFITASNWTACNSCLSSFEITLVDRLFMSDNVSTVVNTTLLRHPKVVFLCKTKEYFYTFRLFIEAMKKNVDGGGEDLWHQLAFGEY